MRRNLMTMASAAAVVALGMSAAQAQVTVTADIDKTKVVGVNEFVHIEKRAFLQANQNFDVDRSAESLAVATQTIQNNVTTLGSGNTATVANNTAAGNEGVLQFNNAAGNLNQQGNLIAASLDGGTFLDGVTGSVDSFADAQASAQQVLQFNEYTEQLQNNTARTVNSVHGNTGVVHGNNAAGDMNQQLNSLSLAVAFADADEGAMALAEADLGQTVQFNLVNQGGGNTATLNNSLSNNIGIVGYNQASGVFNQQGNSVAISTSAPAQAAFR